MRVPLLVLVAAIAAVAAAGTGSGAPDVRIPGLPTAAGYNVRAEFGGSVVVYWGFEHGDERRDCSMWAKGGGVHKFEANSIAPTLGHIQISRRGVGARSWATFSLLGKAKARAERSITINVAGVNWGEGCVGSRPARPMSIDCGERQFPKLRATLFAVDDLWSPTFDPPERPRDELAPLDLALIRFTVTPRIEPFGSCGLPDFTRNNFYGISSLANTSLRVTEREEDALRALRRGRTYRLTDHYGGKCKKGVPARDCAFTLNLWLELTRVS